MVIRERELPLYTNLATGFGFLWTTHKILPILVRVDPVTVAGTAIAVEDKALSIAMGHGSVWVATTRSLVRVEPHLGQVQTITSMEWTGPNALDGKVAAATIGFTHDAVWVAGLFQEAVRRVDPATAQVTAKPPVNRSWLGMAAGHGAVWVRDGDVIRRFDPETWDLVSTLDPGGRPDRVLISHEGLWLQVATAAGTRLMLIDPRIEQSRVAIELDQSPADVHIRSGAVWVSFPSVADPGNRSLVQRFDLADLSVSKIEIDRAVWSLAMDDQTAWATTFRNADGSSHLVRTDWETAATESVFDLASIDLTPFLPLPIQWPPSMPEDEVVFVCAVCATDISRPVGPLPGVPPIPENEVGEYERLDDWVPEGRYFIDPGDTAPAEEVRNTPVLNEVDILNTERDPDSWNGCCGADGLDGPNLRCSNGHLVALQRSDCWSLNGVWLLPDATVMRAAAATL